MATDDESKGTSPTLPSHAARSAPRGSSSGTGGSTCLSEDLVLEYLEGRTTAQSRDQVDQHLDGCNDCWLLVQSLIDGAGEPGIDEPSRFRITTFSIGSLIADRYRIKSFVGRGGMGEVYLAHDTLMSRTVAVKTPLCTSSDDPSALRKFFDEARNADRITHPNICRIHALQEHRDAAGDHPSVLFFTMEFIDGETLAARLRRAQLPLQVTRVIARQLLDGLRAAHEKRVLHLDFKSDNVMLRRGGPQLEAVIMDFGLSRQRDAVLRASQYLRGIGTVQYMALEQLEGQRNLGPAVDVYAFGVVLFEMLTGRLPFLESSLGPMLLKQQHERPPLPSSLRPGLSSALDAFVMKCLNRSASRRFEDAGAALAAFDALADWATPSAPSWWSRWRHRGVAALGLPFLMIPSSDMLPSMPREPRRVEETQLSLQPAPPEALGDGVPPSEPVRAQPEITVTTTPGAAPSDTLPSTQPPREETDERTTPNPEPVTDAPIEAPRRKPRAPILLKGIDTRLGKGAPRGSGLELPGNSPAASSEAG